MSFTAEQQLAVDRRAGSLMLSAGAGSGKTTVLVARFVAALLDDGLRLDQVLAITFTEKAAGELATRVRGALAQAGRSDLAAELDAAWISTIHGFCMRVLRAHALQAGLDPEFTVLDPADGAQLRAAAFELALRELAGEPGGERLIASYRPAVLRSAVLRCYAELRARGQPAPRLPAGPRPPDPAALSLLTATLRDAAHDAHSELAGAKPGKQVDAALALLESVDSQLASIEPDGAPPWPGELSALALKGTAKALKSAACERYGAALAQLGEAAERHYAVATVRALDALLQRFGEHYAASKRVRGALDFEDLELSALALLREPMLAARYRERFARVMLDEAQDTNAVQHELIELVGAGRLFMVGDAQQSIYGFRYADVELFERRGAELATQGSHLQLRTNFRTVEPVLQAINRAFSDQLGEAYMALQAGREQPGSVTPAAPSAPRVELILAQRERAATGEPDPAGGDPEAGEGVLTATPWRVAEARALAARIATLIQTGAASAGEIVILTRASTDMATYAQALAERGVPAQLQAGRGFFNAPPVLLLCGHLRALVNPLDEPAYYAVLLSPLGGLSLDGAVLLAAGARTELDRVDAEALARFETFFNAERAAAAHTGPASLIQRALERNDYGRLLASAPDGDRRLANVRKLMQIARDFEALHGPDLPAFVDSLALRSDASNATPEAEASPASDFGDAVALMTIHAAKGLEFPVVCVADLGRGVRAGERPLIRVGRDGARLGLRLARPGSEPPIDALDYGALAREQSERETAEQRRLFYVAATRARERLILSGAARLDGEFGTVNRTAPIGWLGPALVPEIDELAGAWLRREEAEAETETRQDPAGADPVISAGGVAVSFVRDTAVAGPPPVPAPAATPAAGASREPVDRGAAGSRRPVPTQLSYTAIGEYERCGYRFYVERVLGLGSGERPGGGVQAGIRAHELLRGMDFTDPERVLADPAIPPALAATMRAFVASPTAHRLRVAGELRREQPFVFAAGEQLIGGAFDVLARERDGRLLIVDYKTDRLPAGSTPAMLVEDRYQAQREIYALAVLAGGAATVEVQHLLLAAPQQPVAVSYEAADRERLSAALAARLAGLRAAEYPVSEQPGRERCTGCPAAGGLCPHPLALRSR